MGEFDPKPCRPNRQGSILGTNLGQDEKLARDNWETWGDRSVCRDESTKDYYVLRSAVNLGVQAKPHGALTLESLRENIVTLKSRSDDMRGALSELKVKIEKDNETLKEAGNSHGWFDGPVGFGAETGFVALAFGLVTSVVEDVRLSLILNNPQMRSLELLKRKNGYLESLGGCASASGVKKTQVKIDLKRAVIAAGVVGAVQAINAAFRKHGERKDGPVEEKQPLPDLSGMKETDLVNLYGALLTDYEDLARTKTGLINQKDKIEAEIVQKGGVGPEKTWLDEALGNRTLRLLMDAAGAFGIGATVVRDRYQTYFNYHRNVEMRMKVLDDEAKGLAEREIAGGKCGEDDVTVNSSDVPSSGRSFVDKDQEPPVAESWIRIHFLQYPGAQVLADAYSETDAINHKTHLYQRSADGGWTHSVRNATDEEMSRAIERGERRDEDVANRELEEADAAMNAKWAGRARMSIDKWNSLGPMEQFVIARHVIDGEKVARDLDRVRELHENVTGGFALGTSAALAVAAGASFAAAPIAWGSAAGVATGTAATGAAGVGAEATAVAQIGSVAEWGLSTVAANTNALAAAAGFVGLLFLPALSESNPSE